MSFADMQLYVGLPRFCEHVSYLQQLLVFG